MYISRYLIKLQMGDYDMKDDDIYLLKDIEPLTERETEILKYLTYGKSNAEIAKELFVSAHTVKAHVSSILRKLKVTDRTQAVVKAIKLGLIKI